MGENTSDCKVNLERLLLAYYIKYDRMLELCNACLADINSDTLDIYVDLYDMLKPIYTTDIYADKQYLIVSAVINLAAHLRGYFWSRHRLYTRIYLVYGENLSNQHKQFWPLFGQEAHLSMLNFNHNHDIIKSQLEMIKILCAYIYDVYYVYRVSDFSMFAYDNISKNQNTPTIILTKSKYAYQIPAMCNNVFIFRPKKRDGNDLSYIVSKQYIYGNYFNKITGDKTLELFGKVSPRLLSVAIALTGLPECGLQTLMNTSTAFKMLYEAISNGRIINDYNSDIDYVYGSLIGINKYTEITPFECRYRAVDLITQYGIYNTSAEARDISWFINLNDPNTVKDINNRYFIDNPLDLNNL